MPKKQVKKKKKPVKSLVSKSRQPAKKPKRILILSASPQRDKIVDGLISEELRAMGHEVWTRPCLREGRAAVLEIKPNVVVLPPIRNVYSRDMCATLKSWGVAVATRHTESSCDWTDFKNIPKERKAQILGPFRYLADAEIVWGPDEAQILAHRKLGFPVISVGPVTLDIYFKPDLKDKFPLRPIFNAKYKFDDKKKNLLIASPWGFADSAPDLRIEETGDIQSKEAEARDRHLEMIKFLYSKLSDKWNILVTCHPGILIEPYIKALKELNIPLDTTSMATELLVNTDALVHAGSTMAMEAHCLNIPSFQFGNVNTELSWWVNPRSLMSEVSPSFNSPFDLANAVDEAKKKTNINKGILKTLEEGRYGKIDGLATKRAAKIIGDLNGELKMSWPPSANDYSQLTILKDVDAILEPRYCTVCNSNFVEIKKEWIENFRKYSGSDKLVVRIFPCCPYCGARYFKPEEARA